MLYNKKPCADSKSIKDVLGDESIPDELEFGIMIMGAAAANVEGNSETTEKTLWEKSVEGKTSEGNEADKMDVDTAPVAQGPSGDEVLDSEEFWGDLRGFLSQRLKDDGKAQEVAETFRASWKGKSGSGATWKWGGMKGWKS